MMNDIKIPRVLIYDDENLTYFVGDLIRWETSFYGYEDIGETKAEIFIQNGQLVNNIELDETTMKRIAKFNKEQEIAKLDKVIKEKEQKIKDLEDILQDRSKRVEKIKEFIADIYNIPIDDGEYDYDDYDDYE